MASLAENPVLAAAQTGSPPPVAAQQVVDTITNAPASTLTDTEKSAALIKQTVEQRSGEIANDEALLRSGMAKSNELTSVLEQTTADIAKSTVAIQTQEQTADLKIQQNSQAAVAAMGGLEAMTALLTEQAEEGQRINDLLDERTAILDTEYTSIGIIDDIINEFRVYGTDVDIENASLEYAHTTNQIQTAAAATESFNKVAAADAERITTESIIANSEKIVSIAEQEIAKYGIQGVESNARAVATIRAANGEQLNNVTQLFRVANVEIEQGLRQQQLKMRREAIQLEIDTAPIKLAQAKVNLEASELALKNNKDLSPTKVASLIAANEDNILQHQTLLQAEKLMVDRIMAGQASRGLIVENDATVRLNLRDPLSRQRYKDLAVIGSSKSQSWGATPMDAQKSRASTANAGGERKTMGSQMLDAVEQALFADYTAAGVNPPRADSPEYANAFNNKAAAVLAPFQAEIKFGDGSNPYNVQYMSELEKTTAIQNDPFYQKVIAQAGLKEFNPEVIMQLVQSSTTGKNPQVTPEQAARGVSLLAKTAMALNNEAEGGFSRYGFKNQETYNVRLDNPHSMGTRLSMAGTGLKDAFVSSISVGRGTGGALLSAATTGSAVYNIADETQVQQYIMRLTTSAPKVLEDLTATNAAAQ
jgi:hypothetical protein